MKWRWDAGDNELIMNVMRDVAPEVDEVLDRIRGQMNRYQKREIRLHEAAILYVLTRQFNLSEAHIFEIGTCHGWSASVLAEAAPLAHIVTCTPKRAHVEHARQNLRFYPNVKVVETKSVDLLDLYHGSELDMIFVDGDHDNVADDLPWYNWLRTDGLMLHHDYTPPEAPVRPCRSVWEALNAFQKATHPMDVLLVGQDQEGMAGWYRQKGKGWIDGLRN